MAPSSQRKGLAVSIGRGRLTLEEGETLAEVAQGRADLMTGSALGRQSDGPPHFVQPLGVAQQGASATAVAQSPRRLGEAELPGDGLRAIGQLEAALHTPAVERKARGVLQGDDEPG